QLARQSPRRDRLPHRHEARLRALQPHVRGDARESAADADDRRRRLTADADPDGAESDRGRMTLIDISPVLDPSIAVWPGDTPFARNASLDIGADTPLPLSDVRTPLHAGAHADAPSHYAAGGSDIASRPLEFYIGQCIVLHVNVNRG